MHSVRCKFLVGLLWGLSMVLPLGVSEVLAQPVLGRMPDFPNKQPARWINVKPLSSQDFRGQVVLIEIWTSV